MVMIDVKREGRVVTIQADTGRGWTYPCRWSADGGEDHATYVADWIKKNMFEKLKAMREEAYNEGWKDAKAKREKRTWFRGMW